MDAQDFDFDVFFDDRSLVELLRDEETKQEEEGAVVVEEQKEVVAAVEAGKFAIHCVKHVDQAIEILMHREAGEVNKDGGFPQGTVNGEIIGRLEAIAKMSDKKSDND